MYSYPPRNYCDPIRIFSPSKLYIEIKNEQYVIAGSHSKCLEQAIAQISGFEFRSPERQMTILRNDVSFVASLVSCILFRGKRGKGFIF